MGNAGIGKLPLALIKKRILSINVKPIIIALLLISRRAMITCILLALIYIQNSITMPHTVDVRN